jgi:hypothetical protein
MFRIGDKVDFPVTQSGGDNALSSSARSLIRRSHEQGYLIVKDIRYVGGEYMYCLGKSMEEPVIVAFKSQDLVPYGHSGLLVAPAIAGSRVKCHCGKTHQLITTGGLNRGIYIENVDISGWYTRLNNVPVTKPRGQREYVYYVAYCPECWQEERLRRSSAEQLLPLTPPEPMIEQIRNSMGISNSTGEAIRVPPQDVDWTIPRRGSTDPQSIQQSRPESTTPSEPSRPQITRPFSIWLHHKGLAKDSSNNNGGR